MEWNDRYRVMIEGWSRSLKMPVMFVTADNKTVYFLVAMSVHNQTLFANIELSGTTNSCYFVSANAAHSKRHRVGRSVRPAVVGPYTVSRYDILHSAGIIK